MPEPALPQRGQPANISITNRREPNSPPTERRLQPAPTYLWRERCKHSHQTPFAHWQIHSHINETKMSDGDRHRASHQEKERKSW